VSRRRPSDGIDLAGQSISIAKIKWWRTLHRFTGRRDVLPETAAPSRAWPATAPPPDETTTTPMSIDPRVVSFGAVLRRLLAGLGQVGRRGQFGDHIEQVV
jgi:hypothetical protein